MTPRTLTPRLRKLGTSFPAVFLTGPRQSGKTTLARQTFPEARYLTLEELDVREEATADPRGFLSRLVGPGGLILDEVQHVPGLFSALQGFLDERRASPVILTGSQNFQLSARISQSLAGRAAILELLPFSRVERDLAPARTPDSFGLGLVPAQGPAGDLDLELFTGGYPPIHDRGLEPRSWLDAYVRTYVERDVRSLANIGDLATFTRFVRLCAGRSGQLVNTSALGAEAGIDHTTARRWLSVLEASYILRFLPPHFQNFNKRLVKTPKLYFHDTGLMCALLGLRTAEDLRTHPLRGAVFETWVVSELTKSFVHHGEPAPLFFWRDHGGHEVDLVIDTGARLIPVEVKSGMTVASDAFAGLSRYAHLSGQTGGALVYGGHESYVRGEWGVQGWSGLGCQPHSIDNTKASS